VVVLPSKELRRSGSPEGSQEQGENGGLAPTTLSLFYPRTFLCRRRRRRRWRRWRRWRRQARGGCPARCQLRRLDLHRHRVGFPSLIIVPQEISFCLPDAPLPFPILSPPLSLALVFDFHPFDPVHPFLPNKFSIFYYLTYIIQTCAFDKICPFPFTNCFKIMLI
jgi:hypothetical protein